MEKRVIRQPLAAIPAGRAAVACHLCVFFFWPAGQAIWQSPSSPTRSGSTQFVGFGNFEYLFGNPSTANPS
jgi:ABC-type sugar transport system permease subunit